MDNTAKFNGKGEIYANARPSYAPELFEYMANVLEISRGSVFADIGSGTGIFSEQLLNSGYRVYAVEPNEDMRKKAEERLAFREGFASVCGSDRDTTLPERSVDCVTVAQAFHWFDAKAFGKECRRILKPGGRVAIVYNTRDIDALCNLELADVCRRHCPEFKGFSCGIDLKVCHDFFDGKDEMFCCDNSQAYDRRGYIGRALSSSYSLREGDAGFSDYIDDINRIFDRFSLDGTLVVPMRTVAYIGTLR